MKLLNEHFLSWLATSSSLCAFFYLILKALLLIGGIEKNPGPKNGYSLSEELSSFGNEADATENKECTNTEETEYMSLLNLQKLKIDSLKEELTNKDEEIQKLNERLNKQESEIQSLNSHVLLREQIYNACETDNWEDLKTFLEGYLREDSVAYRQILNINENYPLPFAAAYEGFSELIQVLLLHGLPINRKYKDYNSSLLHGAAMAGEDDLVKLLIRQGADTNVRCSGGATPLHSVAISGNVNTVRVLLQEGADINARDNDGSTPLHAAVYGENLSVIKYLIGNYGCKKSITTYGGETALDYAKLQKNNKIIRLLS